MGNRAVITDKDKKIGVYLHWNGGIDSVTGFLKYCELKGYRNPSEDNYGWARLCQVIGNFFGGEISVGIDLYRYLDTRNGDNGVYIIENWNIVNRLHVPKFVKDTEKVNMDNVLRMMLEIDKCMPKKEQLGEKVIYSAIQTEMV